MSRTLTLLVLVTLVRGCDSRSPLPVRVENRSLVWRHGEVCLPHVAPSGDRPAADTRAVHSLVLSPSGDRAAAVVSTNRQHRLLGIREGAAGAPLFGAGVKVPAGAEVEFSPDGRRVLVLSRADLYLPGGRRPGWNRGALLLDIDAGPWFADVEDALASDSEGWYGASASRFFAEEDLGEVRTTWTPWGCRLEVRYADGRHAAAELRGATGSRPRPRVSNPR
jgi:hypothetical protein